MASNQELSPDLHGKVTQLNLVAEKLLEKATLLDFTELGEVARVYLKDRYEGRTRLLNRCVPAEALNENGFKAWGKVPVIVLREVSHRIWNSSVAQAVQFWEPIVEACRAQNLSLPALPEPSPEPLMSSMRLLLTCGQLEAMDSEATFDSIIDHELRKAGVENSVIKRVLSDASQLSTLCGNWLSILGIGNSVLERLPNRLGGNYKRKFMAAWYLWQTFDMQVYLRMLVSLDRALTILKSMAVSVVGVEQPTGQYELELPMICLLLEDESATKQVIRAVLRDKHSPVTAGTAMPDVCDQHFHHLWLDAHKAYAEAPLGEQEDTVEHYGDFLTVWLFKKIQLNLQLLEDMRIAYFDVWVTEIARLGKELQLWRTGIRGEKRRPELRTTPSKVDCFLVVDGPADEIGFRLFADGLGLTLAAYGILVISSEGSSKMPARVLALKKDFPHTPVVCVVDPDATTEALELKKILRNAPKGSRVFHREGEGGFEEEFSAEQLAQILNRQYPGGKDILAQDFDMTSQRLSQIAPLVKKKKGPGTEFDKVWFAITAGQLLGGSEVPSYFREIIQYVVNVCKQGGRIA